MRYRHGMQWGITKVFMAEGDGGDGGGGGSPSYDFDPSGLASIKADDGQPIFGEGHKIDSLSKFKGPNGTARLAKSYLELESQRDKAYSPLPENATDEQRKARDAALRKARGVPDSPDKYQIVIGDLPKGLEIDNALLDAAKVFAHERGLTESDLQGVINLYNKHQTEAYQNYTRQTAEQQRIEAERNKQAEIQLKGEFGEVKYAEHLNRVAQALRNYATSDAEWENLKETIPKAIANSPLVFRAIAKMSEELGEGNQVQSEFQRKQALRTTREQEFPNSPDMDRR